jgi:hypothetical protein
MKKLLLVTLLAGTALLNGCVMAVGSGEKHIVQSPTLGQQLIDLKAAKDKGAITDDEYGQQKAKLLDGK